MGITILGTGHYVPGVPVTNDQLSKVMETSHEWITPAPASISATSSPKAKG